ncbi:MAG TPA: M15 family metallopeptidase, partial [Microthrixaceae bacterium]|nr:M15 family metallopeptidase [Microthrixaceae bacterium]
MEIPTNVQARINDIRSRFDPGALGATSTSSTTSTGTSAEFASVLAETLAASDTTNGITGLGDTNNLSTLTDLLSTANASRLQSSTGRTTSLSAAQSAYGSSGGVATVAPIATKRAVSNLEGLYENGRLPDEALTPIGVGSHRLAAPAASAFTKLSAAAEADGVTIGVTDSYRSYDAQVDVANRKGLYSQGGLAAKPGTSDHGLGLALDLDLDTKALSWMRANAGRFGFVEDTPRESWHWKFDG